MIVATARNNKNPCTAFIAFFEIRRAKILYALNALIVVKISISTSLVRLMKKFHSSEIAYHVFVHVQM